MWTINALQKDAVVIIVDGEKSVEELKQIFRRATNLWPDASPEVKEVSDLITNGTVLQDYYLQANAKKEEKA